MKRVYVAGELTTGAINPDGTLDAHSYEHNVRMAESMALRVAMREGYAPICVHALARYMFGTLPEARWLAIDLSILEACHAVVLSNGARSIRVSRGVRVEVEHAIALGIPVYAGEIDLFAGRAIPIARLLQLLAVES